MTYGETTVIDGQLLISAIGGTLVEWQGTCAVEVDIYPWYYIGGVMQMINCLFLVLFFKGDWQFIIFAKEGRDVTL